MVNNKGLLIVISGPSAVGKGTICKELVKRGIDNLELSVSATTRRPRQGEIDGINYYFKEKEVFEKMIEREDFLEFARVYDNYYGTPKKNVMDKISNGKDVILEIDIQGAKQVKRNYEDGIFIFIMPPSFKELKSRIVKRGTETQKDMDKRMTCAFEEVQQAKYYDYIVVNDDLNSAVEKIYCIIKAEKCRLSRYHIDLSGFKEEL
ncbi:guanylate kinase [Lutispora saccharofermentans]|uniref:Guanylate kinase n=1 Tax=Lutispora saccharofermentans TaxID=3024236 RepID=A0ABT1N9Z8_9FIRM|nr:guanylate kinase [Lutispora saccharofermentans]MCQ1528068.1 guanylate kinase [Lutispora saccharofermentans]